MKHLLAVLVLAATVLPASATNLVATNSTWKYFKGRSEASSPSTAWRTNGFNDSAWTLAQEPFYYENDPTSATAYTGNTDLTDMDGGYTCIFMRQTFVVPNLPQIQQLQLTALSDDGFIAWINGTEVARFNMPTGSIAYNGSASPALPEPVPLQNDILANFQQYLVAGTNVLAIQAFNSSLSASSDFLIWAGLSASTNTTWSNVGISEFMATNQNTVQDVDGDASPWIELYNPTTNDVSLSGWSLSVDTNNPRQWIFPKITLEADSFIVLFASGKNRTNATNELHTNFRLPVNGGYLALADSSTNIVSSFAAYPAQQTDVSYGRDGATPNLVGYFPSPTPDDANAMGGPDAAPPVVFSRAGGTFLNAFNLQLSTASNAVIHFTLDGTAPTEESATYNLALAITNSVQVRARSFLPGLLPSALHSETYLLLDASLVNTNSDLPAIVIYNFAAGAVPVDDKQFVNLAIYEPQNGVVSLTNSPTLNLRAGIHLHGSSTLNLPKHAFSVDFWDELNNDLDASPFGFPVESDFVLYAPDDYEPVLIHNPVIYQLSNEIGRYASRTKFCEVYINTTGGPLTAANYNGIYVLEEKIKWDDNRVDIKKTRSVDELHPLDNSLPNVTGGYMMKIDRLGDGETGLVTAGQTIVYNDPPEVDLTTPPRLPQLQYLSNYMTSFGLALNATNYTDPTNGYRAFVDVPSWIDSHILNITAFNVDALRLSAYFYKDRSGILEFGPIWDFDRSQGSTDGRDYNPRTWRSTIGDMGTDVFNYIWWGRMFTDIDFWQAWIDRYEDLRTGVLSTNHIFAVIDSCAAQVQHEEPREIARWPGFTTPRSGIINSNGYSYNFPGTYQGEVNFMKQWYTDRLHFMDTNFLAKPLFNNTSGAFLPGATLTLTNPTGNGGTLYYTTNNTDPRLPGGGISTSAKIYASPILLASNLTVTARVFNPAHHNLTGANNPPLSSPWSGVTASTFVLVTPPVITQSPADLDAYLGQTPAFAVQATGSPAPGYQWLLNGSPLAGQTNAQLSLTLTQTNQAGTYSIVATNLAGTNSASFVLTITPKPNLAVTEALSSESKGAINSTLDHEDWWELSNLGNFRVNLQGFRFDDSHDSLADADVITNNVFIQPGESVVLVEDMTAAQFQNWWGASNLPPNLQIITYPSIGFSSSGDAIYLWNAAATTATDTVTSVTFPAASRGVTFGYNSASNTFGALSVAGQNGAFAAAVNGDIGSPGTLINLPRFTHFQLSHTNGFNFTFVTQPTRNYQIQYKQNLADTNWQIFTNFTANSNSFTLADPSSNTNSARYYRIVILP